MKGTAVRGLCRVNVFSPKCERNSINGTCQIQDLPILDPQAIATRGIGIIGGIQTASPEPCTAVNGGPSRQLPFNVPDTIVGFAVLLLIKVKVGQHIQPFRINRFLNKEGPVDFPGVTG